MVVIKRDNVVWTHKTRGEYEECLRNFSRKLQMKWSLERPMRKLRIIFKRIL